MPITTKQLIQTARAITADNPGFLYTSDINGHCYYDPTKANPQGCIIGAVLRQHNLPTPPNTTDPVGAKYVLNNLQAQTLLETTPNELDWLALLQANQDSDYTWGTSITKTDEHNPLN